jgi:bacterioferritin (cytochrome b1)
MKTDENVGKVRTLVRTDYHLGIRMIAEELNMNKEMVRQILTTNLNVEKVCADMVPENLSEDQKLVRKQVCPEVLEKIEEDANFLNTVVTYDET